jgi:hypothetical protein
MLPAAAAEKDEHNHAAKGGPQGGRLLEATSPQAELVVGKDRTVTIHFYDLDRKPVAAGTQTVVVHAEPDSGKKTIEFEKKDKSLVSKSPLPAGEGYNVVVQLRSAPGAKPKNFRIKLDLHTCAECQLAEYACICGH